MSDLSINGGMNQNAAGASFGQPEDPPPPPGEGPKHNSVGVSEAQPVPTGYADKAVVPGPPCETNGSAECPS